ncbi:MAG: hypothetical protein BGO31_15955 [Bacteroidetes bacterium 43-16]|nr:MAG: hypothetical protein BGO31_15955 [Bacteroidetes bacterium 43-16]
MKQNKTKSSVATPPKPLQRTVRQEHHKQAAIRIPAIVVNLIAGIIFLAVITFVKNNNRGYNWMWEGLIKGNIATMEQYAEATNDQKNQERHGNFFTFMDYINKKTPENAIILMPGDSILNQLNPKLKLSGLKNRNMVTFFIYPRKAVYSDSEYDKKELSKANYVALVNLNTAQSKNDPNPKQAFSVQPLP